jgi:hypothetical protein
LSKKNTSLQEERFFYIELAYLEQDFFFKYVTCLGYYFFLSCSLANQQDLLSCFLFNFVVRRKAMNLKPSIRKIFSLVAAGATFFGAEVFAAAASAEDVHEIADICMYSQRILKDYALVGMGITYNDPQGDLEKGIKTVDTYFSHLKSRNLKEKLSAEVSEMEKAWNAIKPDFQKTPDKTKMSDLHKKVEEYTYRCEELAFDLAQDTGIQGERYVVLVAELGMETQRMAALYLMKAWGVEHPNHAQQVKKVADETKRIYSELMAADEKFVSAEIKKRLKDTERDFIAFEVMTSSTSGRFMPTAAEKSADKIFEAVREILLMEQKLVEGSISGYFTPVAEDERFHNIFKILSKIVSQEENVRV